MPANHTPIRRLALLVILIAPLLLLIGAHPGLSAPAAAAAAHPNLAAATFWSSGWTAINQDQNLIFNHNLNVPPEQLAVELWFRDTAAGGLDIHRANYGGIEIANPTSIRQGAFWRNLTANTILVRRLPDDELVDQVNVRVWVAPTPDYDSGWQTIDPDAAHFFRHNLNVTATELTVGLWFRHPLLGIHQYAYGGLTDGAEEQGAYWHSLDDDSVAVYRRPDDIWVEQVRVVVTQGDTPAYDSLVALGDWQTIAPGTTHTFNHNLNENPDLLIVRSECLQDESGVTSIHQMWAGGDERAGGQFHGAYLQRLTANTVQFVRRADDVSCDQARVIIYARAVPQHFCLPFIAND